MDKTTEALLNEAASGFVESTDGCDPFPAASRPATWRERMREDRRPRPFAVAPLS